MPAYGKEQADQREQRDTLMDEEEMENGFPTETEGQEIDGAEEQEQIAKTRECEHRLLRFGIGPIKQQCRLPI